MNFPRAFPLPTLAAALLLPLFNAPAQTVVTSNVAGFTQIVCPANSDTLVALPFTRSPFFTGAVASVSGGVVTFSGTPFTADALIYNPTGTPAVNDHYYLRVGPTTAALTGKLTVAQNSATVTGTGTAFATQLVVGDRLTFSDGANLLTYNVAAIASATSLTLDRAFADAAATTLTNLSATFDHSPLEGRWYAVTANSASTVTLNLNNDSLAALAAGTQVSILPYATFNSVFPAANAGTSFTVTTSIRSRQTQILIPTYSAAGTDLSASAIYFYYSNGANVGWRAVGDDINTDHGNDTLLPDGYFTVRQGNGAPAVTLICNGTVSSTKASTPLATSKTQFQDNAVGLIRPVGVKLNAIGLNPADSSFRATTSTRNFLDRLLIYDNAVVTFDKSATGIYFYYSNGANVGWRAVGDDINTDHGNDVIPASSALTIRKAPTDTGATVNWVNAPNF